MNIVFVLLKRSDRAIGGYKVVYEYANACYQKGHNVSIIYSYEWHLSNKKKLPFPAKKLYYRVNYLLAKKWFSLNSGIKEVLVWQLKPSLFDNCDVVVATAAQTAEPISRTANCEKIYFIQGYENWNMSEEQLLKTYLLYKKHIVISKLLQKKVLAGTGILPALVHNGIDCNIFNKTIPQHLRTPHSISYMYHIDKLKGIDDGLAVIAELKRKYPDLVVKMFGAYPRADRIPAWVAYTQNATAEQLNLIYNETQVFLSTSIEEGFGLTGAESMACGCALVTTGTMGALEYSRDMANALITEPGDVEQMVAKVSILFEDEALRTRLALQGEDTIMKNFQIKTSKEHFVTAIEQLVEVDQ